MDISAGHLHYKTISFNIIIMKKLKVGITYDLAKFYRKKKKDPSDIFDEFDTDQSLHDIRIAIENNGCDVTLLGNFTNLLTKSVQNTIRSLDLVFNDSEGVYSRNREAQVPILLEYLGVPYTGSDALTLSLALDKVMTKRICKACNIPTPKYISTEVPLNENDINDLEFPLIVKPRCEGSSKGLGKKSVVLTLNSLNKEIKRIVSSYNQPALVEQFITGKEYTVPIIGNENPTVYPPIEMTLKGKSFGSNIFVNRFVYTDDVKYIISDKMDTTLKNKLQEYARVIYKAIECRDVGRVDFRIDSDGNPYILEINPIPAFSKVDAFGVLAEYLRISYNQMMGLVLNAARTRYKI